MQVSIQICIACFSFKDLEKHKHLYKRNCKTYLIFCIIFVAKYHKMQMSIEKWFFYINFNNNIFTFRTYTMQGKYCYREKIRLWNFNIFIRFLVSWIHLCYFYGDVCIYVCMYVCVHMCVYVCMLLNTIASKRCIQLSLSLVCIWQDEPVGRTLLI